MDLAVIAPRPRTVRCRCCARSIRVATTGRLPVYCSSRCKQRAFRTMHPEWKPNRPKVSPADRQRRLIWGVLQDAGVIPMYKVLPPRREAEER